MYVPVLAAAVISNPLLVLALSIVLIVVAIAWLRLHAFFALLLAAAFVALLTFPGRPSGGIDEMMVQLGISAGNIAFPIAIAAVIGAAMMESGAADKIVRRFLAVLGEARAPLALMLSAFILGIPVFFDTVLFLTIPLARALSMRTGRNYMLHLLAICAGGVITHATVPPTPGPLLIAQTFNLDLGVVLMAAIPAGLVPAMLGLWFSSWCNRRQPVPLRATLGSSLESVESIAKRDESELPGFVVSVLPIVLPVALIAALSIAKAIVGSPAANAAAVPAWFTAVEFLGNRHVALFLGALIAVGIYLKQKRLGWRQLDGIISEPLATAGVIILITTAGAAYGAMIKNAGLGDAVGAWARTHDINLVLLAWGLTALVRAAQGSTTVAVITAAGILTSLAPSGGFGVHPLYMYLAVGYGGLCLSWMNDSGFWVFSRLSGLTEKETLRSWSVLLTLISVVGLVMVLIASTIFPGV